MMSHARQLSLLVLCVSFGFDVGACQAQQIPPPRPAPPPLSLNLLENASFELNSYHDCTADPCQPPLLFWAARGYNTPFVTEAYGGWIKPETANWANAADSYVRWRDDTSYKPLVVFTQSTPPVSSPARPQVVATYRRYAHNEHLGVLQNQWATSDVIVQVGAKGNGVDGTLYVVLDDVQLATSGSVGYFVEEFEIDQEWATYEVRFSFAEPVLMCGLQIGWRSENADVGGGAPDEAVIDWIGMGDELTWEAPPCGRPAGRDDPHQRGLSTRTRRCREPLVPERTALPHLHQCPARLPIARSGLSADQQSGLHRRDPADISARDRNQHYRSVRIPGLPHETRSDADHG